jgi:hypothetical protein
MQIPQLVFLFLAPLAAFHGRRSFSEGGCSNSSIQFPEFLKLVVKSFFFFIRVTVVKRSYVQGG